MDEFNIIKKYFYPLTNKCPQSQLLTDDVAYLEDKNLVVSSDLMTENIHFKITDGAFNIANRLIRSNLSDIASSGSKPLYYTLNFTKNNKIDENFIKEFSKALEVNNQKFNINLIGGDSSKSDNNLFFSITIFGESQKYILSRNNAVNQNLIFTSGYIGDAFLGRIIAEKQLNISNNKKDAQFLINRYYNPEPRISLGIELVKKQLSKCAIDISDGLLADLNQICLSSKIKANIFYDKIPISKAAKNILKHNPNTNYQDLMSGGDDYELIFTIKKENIEELSLLSKTLNIKLTNIGYFTTKNIESEDNIQLFKDNKLIKINKLGYEH